MRKLEEKKKKQNNFFEEYINPNKNANLILNLVGGRTENNIQKSSEADNWWSSQIEI